MCVCVCDAQSLKQIQSVRYDTPPLYSIVRTAAMFVCVCVCVCVCQGIHSNLLQLRGSTVLKSYHCCRLGLGLQTMSSSVQPCRRGCPAGTRLHIDRCRQRTTALSALRTIRTTARHTLHARVCVCVCVCQGIHSIMLRLRGSTFLPPDRAAEPCAHCSSGPFVAGPVPHVVPNLEAKSRGTIWRWVALHADRPISESCKIGSLQKSRRHRCTASWPYEQYPIPFQFDCSALVGIGLHPTGVE